MVRLAGAPAALSAPGAPFWAAAGGRASGRWFWAFPGCLPRVGCVYVWGSEVGSRRWTPNAVGRSPGPGRRARRAAGRAAEARGSPSRIDSPRLAGLARPLSLTRVSQHCVIPWRPSLCRGDPFRGIGDPGRAEPEIVHAKTACLGELQNHLQSLLELLSGPSPTLSDVAGLG